MGATRASWKMTIAVRVKLAPADAGAKGVLIMPMSAFAAADAHKQLGYGQKFLHTV
jgi:hypothetical protein